MSELSERFTSRISMRDIVSKYGLEMNRQGFMKCPFHSDDTPSLKVYEDIGKGFYCFSCNKGGSIINFVMGYFGLVYADAVKKLNDDFNLNILETKPEDRLANQYSNRRHCLKNTKKKDIVKSSAKSHSQLIDEHREIWQSLIDVEPFSDEHQVLCERLMEIGILIEQKEGINK
jgi:DNA primase